MVREKETTAVAVVVKKPRRRAREVTGGEIMSRIVFTDKAEFLRWAKKHCTPGQYEIFVTSFGEVVLAPTKSTRSLRYAYVDIYSVWDAIEKAEDDIKAALPKVDVYHIQKFDWASDRDIKAKGSHQ